MTVKTTGAEFKKFYNDAEFWPYGVFHYDEEIEIDGIPRLNGLDDINLNGLSDSARLVLSGGYIELENGSINDSFEGYFRKWRKKQTVIFLIVEVKNDQVDAVKDAIKSAGGKIKK